MNSEFYSLEYKTSQMAVSILWDQKSAAEVLQMDSRFLGMSPSPLIPPSQIDKCIMNLGSEPSSSQKEKFLSKQQAVKFNLH